MNENKKKQKISNNPLEMNLTEIVAIRNSIQLSQQALTRIEHRCNNDEMLPELMAIKNSLQLSQQSLNRIEHRQSSKKKPPSVTPGKASTNSTVPAQRQLLKRVYNRSPQRRICVKHKLYGPATPIGDCPGPAICSYIPPPSGKNRMQRRLEKFSANLLATQQPQTNSPQQPQSILPTPQTILPPPQPILPPQQPQSILPTPQTILPPPQTILPPPKPQPTVAQNGQLQQAIPAQQWSGLIDIHHAQTNNTSMTAEMEQELLDVSDSE